MKTPLLKLCFIAWLLTSTLAYAQVPLLNSFSDAKPTIYLDFDGETVQTSAWQSGNAFYCNPAILTSSQIIEIFKRVSEDYRPFNVNITTDANKYILAPPTQRVRVIVTPTSAWYPNAGGVSYNGNFVWGNDVPSFVFSDKLGNKPKNIAECCSHESGHSLGLSHQAKYDADCNLKEPYHTGFGSGETGWAPVMGNSYGKNMTGWNNGPTPFECADVQDNLTILTTVNGFTYRDDDYSENLDNNAFNLNPISFSTEGVISTANDKDAFKITLSKTGFIHAAVTPFNLGANDEGANVDIAVSLYNNNNELIKMYNPLTTMNVVIDTTLTAGTYYLLVDGLGNNNTDNYGSLGSYTVNGFSTVLPIKDIKLKGINDKGLHKLSWSIIADEPVTKQVLETSTNGINFQPLFTDATAAKSYAYKALQADVLYYRLKAFTANGKFEYSNTVALKATENEKQIFDVQTLVLQTIKVNASENYSYQIFDTNARLMASGKQTIGTNYIDVQTLPKGMYIIQLLSNNTKQTQRIIRQ